MMEHFASWKTTRWWVLCFLGGAFVSPHSSEPITLALIAACTTAVLYRLEHPRDNADPDKWKGLAQ
jgi:hypothetical protein